MIDATEAELALERHRRGMAIPGQAKLSFIEKRWIELADRDELSPLLPASPAAEGADVEVDLDALPDGATGGNGLPVYTETLVWVGRFVAGVLWWELAVDASGALVRVRRSR